MDSQPRPLSTAQSGVWFSQELDPDGLQFVVGEYVHIHGPVDEDRFAEAAAIVLAGAETLRVRFERTPTQVVQHLVPDVPPVRRLDFSMAEDPLALGRQFIDAEYARSYDLTEAPPFDQYLIKAGPADYLWCLRFHHVICDANGLAVFVRRVAKVYTALCLGEQVDREVFDHVDTFLVEEARYRESSRFADDVEFWRTRLSDVDAPLPAGGQGSGRATGHLRHTARLPQERWARVRARAAELGGRWPAMFCAAEAVTMHAETGEREVVLGLAVAARTGKVAKESLGMVSNVLPMRVVVDPAASVDSLVRAVTTETLTVLRHQRYRFEDMLRDRGAVHGGRRLIGPTINLVSMDKDLDFAGHSATVHLVSARSTDDFTVGVYDNGEPDLRVDADAGAARYTEADLAGHLDRLLTAVTAIAQAPLGTPVGRLALARETDHVRIGRWGSGAVTPPRAESISDVFASVVAKSPARTALWSAGAEITYAVLDDRVNRLAGYLAARGVGPGVAVGVALDRSVAVAVAFLALAKLGAVCVPLHGDLPAERKRWIMAHTGVRLVLDAVPPETEAAVAPDVRVPPDQVACVVFTSGSTGTPKGVGLTHRDILTRVADSAWQGPEHERTLFHSPHSWDAVVYEMWMPLLTGRCVVVAPPGDLEVADYDRVITEGRVTAAFLSAGLFDLIAEQDPAALGVLRNLSVGGDVIAPTTVAMVRQANPDLAVDHLYGPVETTMFALSYPVPAGPVDTEPLPIGNPADNTGVRVLDPALRPVPPGMPGEIYLSGSGLAQGYHDAARATSERFVADPWGPPGTRMYRTGDAGRWDETGRVCFLGRVDRQVKINGFRVEPGECEAMLCREPEVAAAAVVARGTGPSGRSLVGYVVPRLWLDTDELRERMAAKLPQPLTPSVLVALDSLPLNRNGKVDLAALPEVAAGAGTAARTPRQQVLASLFAEVLDVTEVSTDDDFFALGGNSLAALRFTGRVRSVLGVSVSVKDVFEAPSVRAFERHLDATAAGEYPPLVRADRDGPIPLAPTQLGLWLASYLGDHQPDYLTTLALEVPTEVDVPALRAALRDVAERHETLRTILPHGETGPEQRILPATTVTAAFQVVETTRSKLDDAITAELGSGFDLLTEPPVRLRLFSCGQNQPGVLLFVLHHAAVDGHSLTTLRRDYQQAYTARAHGTTPNWPPRPVRYTDYAHWVLESLGDEKAPTSLAARQAEYWRAALAGLPEETALPTDHPRTELLTRRPATVPLSFDAETHHRMASIARECAASTYMVLHTAITAALRYLGAGDDVPVGVALSGRGDDLLEGLVGCLVNTVVIRTDLSDAPTYRELIGRVRDSVLAAYDHRELPFDRVVELVNPARTTTRHPLVQAGVSYHQAPEIDAGNWPVRQVPAMRIELDLLFQLAEHGTGGISGDLFYAAELFAPETAHRITTTVEAMVAALCRDIDDQPQKGPHR